MVTSVGKLFILIGLFFTLLGALIILFSKFKFPFPGKLPGDILIKKDNFIFYFPLTTSIILSIIISFIFYFFSKR